MFFVQSLTFKKELPRLLLFLNAYVVFFLPEQPTQRAWIVGFIAIVLLLALVGCGKNFH